MTSPAGHTFNPHQGQVTEKGRFVCPGAATTTPSSPPSVRCRRDQLLPISAYGLQAYAPGCDPANDPRARQETADLFVEKGAELEIGRKEEEEEVADTQYTGPYVPPTQNLVWKQKGKFYARHAPADQALYSQADNFWEKHRDSCLIRKARFPKAITQTQMIKHNYRRWEQMFNDRQLLGLSTLLAAIRKEK